MATKRKRGSTWFYTVKRAALLPKPLNLSFADEAEGDAYVAHLEQLLNAGIVPPEFAEQACAIVNVADAIREYRIAVSVGQADKPVLDLLSEELALVRALSIDYAYAEGYIKRAKQKLNLAPSTIRHRVGAISRCFDWLTRKGEIPGNPWRLLPKGYATYTQADGIVLDALGKEVKEDQSRDRRIEHGEEANIRNVLAGNTTLMLKERPALAFMFELDIETGMRMREIFTLRSDQIDVSKKTIFLEKTKNGHKRQVPLSPHARSLCADYLATLGEGPVFPWVNWERAGNRDSLDEELRRVTALLSRQFARIFAAAGCPDLTFHDLRHELTCRLYERTDLSDVEIAKILGWSSLRMALRYANLRGSTLADRL